MGRAAEKRRKTGWEETEPTRQLCISGWSGVRGRQHGDENSQESKYWERAWRKVEGVMGDIHISRKLKGKVLNSCLTPAYLEPRATHVESPGFARRLPEMYKISCSPGRENKSPGILMKPKIFLCGLT